MKPEFHDVVTLKPQAYTTGAVLVHLEEALAPCGRVSFIISITVDMPYEV